MKLAFVVQRYGRDILGGSETLARQIAERLGRRHEITVLTTTAKDYITWRNEYEPGEEKHKGVKILRFPVVGERNLEEFNQFSEQIYTGKATREAELEWLDRQGPVVPKLVEYLEKEHERFDLIVFFTYLYYPTFYGLKVAPEKSILVPTAHDEPALRLSIYREMFQLPSSFLFNTEAEEVLVLERFHVHKKMRETIGMGMDLLEQPDTGAFRRKHQIPGAYLLYAGRIDAGKGLDELFRYFTFYKEENPASGNLQLILIGRLSMKLPDDPSIRYIGFVDEGDKLSAMAGAAAVVQPSSMESLSIVTLESFSVGTPVLVNAASRVLADHCRKANAGFFYRDFEEFEAVLDLLFSDRGLSRALGKNGQRYVKENYGWSKLLAKYELAFRASARPAKEPKGARPASPPDAPEGFETQDAPEREPEFQRERERELELEAESQDAPESGIPAEEAEELVTTDSAPALETDTASDSDAAQAESAAYEPEPRTELAAEPEPEPEAEAEAEAEPGPAAEPEPEREPEREPELAPPPARASHVDDRVARATEERGEGIGGEGALEATGHEPEPEPEPEPETESEPEPESEAKPAREMRSAVSGPQPEPEPEREPAAELEAESESESDTDSGLPSFYRASLPPPRPAPPPEPPRAVAEERKTASASKPEPAPAPAPESEPLEPGELPAFFRPRKSEDDERTS